MGNIVPWSSASTQETTHHMTTSQPKTIPPKPTHPETTQPKTASQPKPTHPKPTQPETTQPKTASKPKRTHPKPTQSETTTISQQQQQLQDQLEEQVRAKQLLVDKLILAVANGVKRSALGRDVSIGDFYDLRTDCFTGRNVWKDGGSAALITSVNVDKNNEESSEIIISNTVSERLEKLGIEGNLKVNCTVGLSTPIGYAIDLLKVEHEDDIYISMILVYTRQTKHEGIGDWSKSGIECLLSDASISSDQRATHVVTAITYGATVCIRLTYANTSNFNADVVRIDLENRLRSLLSGKNTEELDDSYAITVISDIIPHTKGSPWSITELSKEMSKLQQCMGKGRPLNFILKPIEEIAAQVKLAICHLPSFQLDEATCQRIVEIFDSFKLSAATVKQLEDRCQRHKTRLSQNDFDEVMAFIEKLDIEEKELTAKFAQAVTGVRSKTTKISKLNRLIEKYNEGSTFTANDINEFHSSRKQIADKLAVIDLLQEKGVEYIDYPSWIIDDASQELPEFYVFYAETNSKEYSPELWLKNQSIFFNLVATEKELQKIGSGDPATRIYFFYIDCDKVKKPLNVKDICIHHYKNRVCISKDVALDNAAILSIARSTAECMVVMEPVTEKPIKRLLAEFRCPGRSCDYSSKQVWLCQGCSNTLEYGFDEFFYCSCGRARVDMFRFKCNGLRHKGGFEQFSEHDLDDILGAIKPPRELNILLLGETGVGKSTWVNAFANYVAFPTLDEAGKCEAIYPIVATFTMTNEKMEERVIKTGTDNNENHQTGQIATQYPKSYVFKSVNMVIRIIDTPGIGDVRGVEQDKLNMQNIVLHLANIEKLNCICILMKPNNARVNAMFSFCIKELLTQLHRDACKNIVFCFTNARGTFYKPGDTLPVLKSVLAQNESIGIELTSDTVYCMDNEAFRYLAACKNGISFSSAEQENYRKSWEISVKEIDRMIQRVAVLHPHKVRDMTSLNDARRLIVMLSRPICEISSTLESNISVIEDRTKKLKSFLKDKDETAKSLYIPTVDLRTIPLEYPRTVCATAKCTDIVVVNTISKVDYKTHCHDHCYITGVETGTINLVALQLCKAMGPAPTFLCNECGCSWRHHMHVTYECEQFQSQTKDENVEKLIERKESVIRQTEANLQSLKERTEELMNEKNEITKVCAIFSCFLKQNAIAQCNDSIADYMNHLIEIEKGKADAGGDRKILDGLQQMRTDYWKEKEILDAAILDPHSKVTLPTADKITQMISELYGLRIAGPMLKSAMKVATKTAEQAVKYGDKVIDLKRSDGSKTAVQ